MGAEYMGHFCPHRARIRIKMNPLLVCFSVVAVALAQEDAAKPALLPALGYPGYAFGGYPYAYPHAPVRVAAPEITLPTQTLLKYVPNEVEFEVKSFQPELVQTGCVNHFGNAVPCFQAGEARRQRSADETPAATEVLAAAPLAAPYFYGGYGGYPYAHHLAAPYFAAPKVNIPDPIVKEIPYNVHVPKHVVEKVPIQPVCQNGAGLLVPCL